MSSELAFFFLTNFRRLLFVANCESYIIFSLLQNVTGTLIIRLIITATNITFLFYGWVLKSNLKLRVRLYQSREPNFKTNLPAPVTVVACGNSRFAAAIFVYVRSLIIISRYGMKYTCTYHYNTNIRHFFFFKTAVWLNMIA